MSLVVRRLSLAGALLLAGCGGGAIPDPHGAVEAYVRAARAGDAALVYGLLTERSQQALGHEGVGRAVEDARAALSEAGARLEASSAHVEQEARLRFEDGEEARLPLQEGQFRVSSTDALPAAARTPGQALEQLRRVLSRRSYAGLLRVLSRETRDAIERDLRGLVNGLERPDALDVKVQGDAAQVMLPGGHTVRLRREGGRWSVEDFD